MSIRNCLLLLLVTQLTCSSVSAQMNLFDAIRSGSSDKVSNALKNGASANDSLNGYSVLMCAALNGTVEQMSVLITHGANVNYQSADSTTALWPALPDMDKIDLLLNHGADINHKIDGYG